MNITYITRAILLAAALLVAAALSTTASADSLPDLPVMNSALTLRDALAVAAEHNIARQQAGVDTSIATDAVQSARSQTEPGIAATTYGLAGNAASIVGTPPGVFPSNNISAASGGALGENFILMAPLYTGGRLSGPLDSARRRSEAAALAQSETDLATQESVVDAYTGSLLDSALVDVAQARLTAEDEQVRVTQDRVTAGSVPPLDLLREQAEEASAKQQVVAAQSVADIAVVQLKAALGISQASTITLADTLDTIALPAGLPAGLPQAIAAAEANRPDLRAACKGIDAAREDLRAAEGTYAPQIYAVGMADVPTRSTGAGQGDYTVGLTAGIPLFDGGERRAEVGAARKRLERAILDTQSLRQTIDQEVATAWLNLQSTTQEVTTAQAGVTAAQQAYDLATLRYNAGKSVVAERLDALAALTRARGDLAAATAAILTARARLMTSMGTSCGPLP
ncbi:MAG: TolC family protein [Capsulimonadaceae bacterium]